MEDDVLNDRLSTFSVGRASSGARLSRDTLELLLQEWKFFIPTLEITANIVMLNREFGDDFDKRRERRVREREGIDWDDPVLPESNEVLFLKKVGEEIKGIISHGTSEDACGLSHSEAIEYYSKFLSERIYNHLAMLARSPHAQEHGTFSISEELSSGIAGRIGLGSYLSSRTPETLRRETAVGLNDLAYDFQQWLVEKKEGWLTTTWGMVCSSERAQEVINEGTCAPVLILEADVKKMPVVKAAPVAAQSNF